MELSPKARKLAVLAVAAFLFLLFALLTKCEVTMAGNEASRFGSVQAFAEQNAFALNNTCFRTVDQIKKGDLVYSDKPLALPFLHGLLYKALAAVLGINFTDNYFLSIYLTNLLGIGLLNVLLFLLFFRALDRSVEAPFESKLLLSASLVPCSFLLSYGVSMNNHTPAALLVFGLFLLLKAFPERNNPGWAFLCGLCAGLLFTFEFPIGGLFGLAAFVCVALTAQGAWLAKLSKLAGYSAGGLLPIAGLLLLNRWAFGSFLPQYVGSGGTFTSLLAPDATSILYCLNALFGSKGFFSYMPALLLIVPVLLFRPKSVEKRVEAPLLAAASASVLFYGFFTNEYGGWAYGFRYLVPLIPLLWFFIARDFAPRWGSWSYKLLCALLLWGLLASYVGASNPWCAAYEGVRSGPNSTDYYVRNSFLSNLMALSFERNPDGALFRFLSEKVYGPSLAAASLNEAFVNAKKVEELQRLRAYCAEHPETAGRIAGPYRLFRPQDTR